MKHIIITNNPMVYEHYHNTDTVIYHHDFSFLQVLTLTRDKIHVGHRLLTHPLSGSIKPNETPYKTIIISDKNTEIDLDSIRIIEDSIASYKKFVDSKGLRRWSDSILQDFQLIDFDLILNAI